MLSVKDLISEVDGEKVLKGIDVDIEKGKVVYLMGPNGSGKSSLAMSVIGNPR